MSALLSASKASALLTRVQLNPEIGTNDASYVTDLVQRAAEDLVSYCKLPRYPELSKGYAKSAAGATEDISSIASNEFEIAVNASAYATIELTLSNCDTGANTAAEMQTQIRAFGDDGFDEVTVSFAGTGSTAQYTVTSGRYGEYSLVSIRFTEAAKHVCQNLLLSPEFGGTEVRGMAAREEADDAVVEMVEILYRKLGLEGVKSGSVPGDGNFAMYENELSPGALRKLNNMRRMFRWP